jgi:hypothetical protein
MYKYREHTCVNPTYRHDDFEDMYRCNLCGYFWYPEEIGKELDANPGHARIGQEQLNG